jgi:polyvinyl alcohol dehydrogenase (cytochrome)
MNNRPCYGEIFQSQGRKGKLSLSAGRLLTSLGQHRVRCSQRIAAGSVVLILIAFTVSFLPAQGQPGRRDQPAAQAGALTQGSDRRSGSRAGQALFQDHCASCHTGEGLKVGDRLAAPFNSLQEVSPERLLESIKTGSMQGYASRLTDLQKQQMAEFIAGRPIGSADAGDIKNMTNRCPSNPPLRDPTAGPAWNGWSSDLESTRFQPAQAAGLSVEQVPQLMLKWAFGVPNAAEMYSQPTVASGRVFFGSDSAFVYSVDAKTGCAYWSFQAEAGVRTAPTVAPIKGHGTTRYAVYFADATTRIYALDAQTGKLLWKKRAGDHPRAKGTATPTVYNGRIYVPVSSTETTHGAMANYECCSFRGHVVALDANTGERVWRTFVIPQQPDIRGKNKQGLKLWGPSGAAIWNSPTIDVKRRLIYVGTGNSYTEPAADTTDSIVAIEMDSGKIAWHYQDVKGDAFLGSCKPVNESDTNCPQKLGPDWDFGGNSIILAKLPNGSDLLVGGSKGGISVGIDPDKKGAVVWRTNLAERPPSALGLIVFTGAADSDAVYYGLQRQPGGAVAAVRLADGSRKWTTPLDLDRRGLSAANTIIPGVLFAGSWDGVLRALSTTDGSVIWEYNTAREYKTVNGVPGKGGALAAPGPTVADGTLFVTSGYIGIQNGAAGNVLLAFAPSN